MQAADPRRGRFLSFLLTSFKYFLPNERDREHALKRGGGQRLLAFDLESAEARYAAEPVAAFTPESIFERQWAQGVLDRGLATLRAECDSAGKASTFVHLEEFILGDRSPGGYAQVAETLSATEGAIKVTVHRLRLRRRLRELLRVEIASTVTDDGDIDAEIRHLISVLAR